MKWHVLVTRSRHEKKSAQLLTSKGLEVYLPLQKVMRQWSDRKKLVDVPLFSGYIFIRYDESRRQEVLNVPGIVRFVRYDKQDATIPEDQVRAIRMAIDEDIEMDVTELRFTEGEEIRIISGPFRGVYGKIINYNSRKKIMISIDIIGKNIVIETGKTRIEKMPKNEQKPV
jgi:transcriptional antiterminator RfaH